MCYSIGYTFPINQIIEDVLRKEIETLFKKNGEMKLTPVVEASGGRFGYEEARLVRAWMNYHSRG